MPYQAVSNCAEVSVEGAMDGKPVVNTFYFRHAAGWGQDELDTLAHAAGIAWAGSFLPLANSSYSFVKAVARDLRASVGLIAEDASSAGTGALTNASQANNVALSVKRASGFTGRSSRGRVYIPVTDSSHLADSGHVSSAFGTAIKGVLDTFQSAIELVDWEAVIVSRAGSGATPTEAVVYTLLEWVVVNLAIDSMRRRLVTSH